MIVTEGSGMASDRYPLHHRSEVAVDVGATMRVEMDAFKGQATTNVIGKNGHIATWLISAFGVWLVGLGLFFIVLRPPLLPEDPRFIGTTLAQIRTAVPGLENWLNKVFIVMGGFRAGTGVLIVFVVTVALPPRLKGTP